MRFSSMFELKKDRPKKNKKERIPNEVFMGIIFLVCGVIQSILFGTILVVYKQAILDKIWGSCAALLCGSCYALSIFCFGDHISKRREGLGTLMVLCAIAWLIGIIIFAIIGIVGGLNG